MDNILVEDFKIAGKKKTHTHTHEKVENWLEAMAFPLIILPKLALMLKSCRDRYHFCPLLFQHYFITTLLESCCMHTISLLIDRDFLNAGILDILLMSQTDIKNILEWLIS